jgi:hypothetical protein
MLLSRWRNFFDIRAAILGIVLLTRSLAILWFGLDLC